MKEIQLTKGNVALVDDADYEWLNQWKWQTKTGKNTLYATRTITIHNGKRITIWMHRLILGLTDPKTFGDHEDGNGLNNQRYNIRECTRRENNRNRRPEKGSLKGVDIHNNLYRARINNGHRSVHLGYFRDEISAAKAYNEAALEFHGKFAKLNEI